LFAAFSIAVRKELQNEKNEKYCKAKEEERIHRSAVKSYMRAVRVPSTDQELLQINKKRAFTIEKWPNSIQL
jgi:hypothetical protein